MLGLHVSEVELKVFSAFLMSKPLSVTEAAMTNLSLSLVQYSTAPEKINKQPRNSRLATITPSRAGFVIHPVQIYENRPDCLEHVTFCRYFIDYHARSKTLEHAGMREYIGTDKSATPLHVYTAKRLIAFSNYPPSNHLHGFFFNVLLQRVPFRQECELLSIQISTTATSTSAF